MSGCYLNSVAQCPFFHYASTSNRQVVCEGLVDDSAITLRFQRKKDWEIQVGTFCCNRYTACEIYQAIIEAKYAE